MRSYERVWGMVVGLLFIFLLKVAASSNYYLPECKLMNKVGEGMIFFKAYYQLYIPRHAFPVC